MKSVFLPLLKCRKDSIICLKDYSYLQCIVIKEIFIPSGYYRFKIIVYLGWLYWNLREFYTSELGGTAFILLFVVQDCALEWSEKNEHYFIRNG